VAITTATAAGLPRAIDAVRADFPILSRQISGKPLVYVDNAATSQKPLAVIEAIDSYYRESNANVHRSMHQLAEEAEQLYETARRELAAFIGADAGEIVFVRNATEAINLVRYTWARKHVSRGDVVLITEMEHHSNIVPWQLLCEERGADLDYLTVNAHGRLDLAELDSKLDGGRVRLVAYSQVSNVLGTINPVAEVAAFIGADAGEIVFVRNATEAINLVRYTWAREHVSSGDVVLITEMEHHSNIVPWQLLCEERGADLDYLTVNAQGRIDLTELDSKLDGGRVRLVAITQVSNVLGTINPVAEVTARAHRAGATVLVDGAQAVPQMPVSVSELGADFYAFTGHKMLGPTGIGVLYGRRELLDEMPPFLGGGSMIREVGRDSSTWADVPAKFEAGTPAIAEGAGLGAAVRYLSELGMDSVRDHERGLTAYALERLSSVTGLTIFGPEDAAERGSLVSFTIDGIHPHDLAEICNREAVCIRAGHHCAQPLMGRLGVAATARVSFSVYNTRQEVDRVVEALEIARSVFGL
jgi:cysteine desulfurase/selenocysteine lyase